MATITAIATRAERPGVSSTVASPTRVASLLASSVIVTRRSYDVAMCRPIWVSGLPWLSSPEAQPGGSRGEVPGDEARSPLGHRLHHLDLLLPPRPHAAGGPVAVHPRVQLDPAVGPSVRRAER